MWKQSGRMLPPDILGSTFYTQSWCRCPYHVWTWQREGYCYYWNLDLEGQGYMSVPALLKALKDSSWKNCYCTRESFFSWCEHMHFNPRDYLTPCVLVFLQLWPKMVFLYSLGKGSVLVHSIEKKPLPSFSLVKTFTQGVSCAIFPWTWNSILCHTETTHWID